MAATATPVAVLAQEPETQPTRRGILIGAGAGIATGLGIARLTDYELQEGGLFTVGLLGAAWGALVGSRLAATLGEPWQESGSLEVTFPWAMGWSGAPGDVESAFAVSGLAGTDTHHALVPALTVTLDIIGPIRVGAEVSGVRAARVHSGSAIARLQETVDGHTVSAIALLATRPSATRRWTLAAGGGLDRSSVTVLSWFDQLDPGSRPPDTAQPRRSERSEATGWDPQLRAAVAWHLTHGVSLGVNAIRRWTDPVTVPAIEIVDANGVAVARHGAHAVSPASFHLSFGVGMRF